MAKRLALLAGVLAAVAGPHDSAREEVLMANPGIGRDRSST
jgi:hypothetical protein